MRTAAAGPVIAVRMEGLRVVVRVAKFPREHKFTVSDTFQLLAIRAKLPREGTRVRRNDPAPTTTA